MPLIMLVLVTAWAAWTALVDFFLVPAVFATIPDFFLAGEMGIQVFTRLNQLEFPLACGLFACTAVAVKRAQLPKWLLTGNLLLVGIAGVYLFSLTPKISELTAAWAYADKMGTLGTAGIVDVQQLHQSYHRMYVAMDTVKLLLLLGQGAWLGWSITARREASA